MEEDTLECHHSSQVFKEAFPIQYPQSQEIKTLEFDLSDNDDDSLSDNNCFHTIASIFEHGKGPRLPNHFRLKESYPGEPFFMKLRQKPCSTKIS